MSADVGGQLETVPPKRSLFGPDYLRIVVLIAVAAVVHIWLVAHTAVPARDSLDYARIALNLSHPNALAQPGDPPHPRIEVIRDAVHPPGYPVAVWVAEILLRPVVASLPDRVLLATQVVNAVAAVLLVVPLYLIGRILFGRNVGFAAALLFEVLPVPARVTSDGLSEGLYLLVMAVAVLLAVRAARRPGIGGFLLCGLATGISYLVRPEGLLVVGAVTAVIVAAGWARRWPRDVALGRATAMYVGVALIAVPYMVLIGDITHKPAVKSIMSPFDENVPRPWLKGTDTSATARPMPLFAAWWNPVEDADKNRVLWSVGAVWSEMIKSLHYVVGVLALVGLVAHRRQLFAPDPGMWVLVALAALNLSLLFFLALGAGYVSERHTVLLVMLACIFAAAAIEPLAQSFASLPRIGRLIGPKLASAALLVALVISTVPFTFKTMHPQRVGHKFAGRWLAEHMHEGDWLKDPLSWAEWYAGRTLYQPVVYHGQPDVKWVIIENGKTSPHSRLPQWDMAREWAAQGELVYRWPENARPDQPAVEVYRVKCDQPPAAPPPPGRAKKNAGAGTAH